MGRAVVTAAVRYRLWLWLLASREIDLITQGYAYPPRGPLSDDESSRIADLCRTGDEAYADALARAGVERGSDEADELWREAGQW